MPNLINIPDDISCIHPYVLTATATVATAIVVYLIKRLREKEKELKEAVLNHISDLKQEHQNTYNIYDKKISFVLQTLENQIAKLK